MSSQGNLCESKEREEKRQKTKKKPEIREEMTAEYATRKGMKKSKGSVTKRLQMAD